MGAEFVVSRVETFGTWWHAELSGKKQSLSFACCFRVDTDTFGPFGPVVGHLFDQRWLRFCKVGGFRAIAGDIVQFPFGADDARSR